MQLRKVSRLLNMAVSSWQEAVQFWDPLASLQPSWKKNGVDDLSEVISRASWKLKVDGVIFRMEAGVNEI